MAAGRRLKAVIYVHDGMGGTKQYGPNDEVPDEVAKTLGGHVWVEEDTGEADTSEDSETEPRKATRSSKSRK